MSFPLPIAVALTLCVGLSACGRSAPEADSTAAPRDTLETAFVTFSGERALDATARFVALGEKIPGSPAQAETAAWLCRQFEEVGVFAEIQEFTDSTPSGPLPFRNVIARIPAAPVPAGSPPPRILLLGAHYDTKTGIPGFVGANDSGSGTGLILELARALAAAPAPPPMEIRFALFDGEECAVRYAPNDGFHGSRHLAATMADSGELDRVAAMILLDMVGDRDLNIAFPYNGTPALASLAFAAARMEGVRSAFRLSPGAILDDHIAFLDRGVPAIDFIDFDYGSAPGLNDYWHTPEDTMDKLSADSLSTVGRVVLRVMARVMEGALDEP